MEFQSLQSDIRYLSELNTKVNALLAEGWTIRNEFVVPGNNFSKHTAEPHLVITLQKIKTL